MKTTIQGTALPKGKFPQPKKLSFYEEHYILEPDDTDDAVYFYGSDHVYNLGRMDFIFN